MNMLHIIPFHFYKTIRGTFCPFYQLESKVSHWWRAGIWIYHWLFWGSQWVSSKDSASHYKRCRRHRFNPWVGKIPWQRKWLPTPVFLPGKSCGQRSLGGYNPQGCKESDTTEWLSWLFLRKHIAFLGVSLLGCLPSGPMPQLTSLMCCVLFSCDC